MTPAGLPEAATALGAAVVTLVGKFSWDRWRGNGVVAKVDSLVKGQATLTEMVGKVQADIGEVKERVSGIEGNLQGRRDAFSESQDVSRRRD